MESDCAPVKTLLSVAILISSLFAGTIVAGQELKRIKIGYPAISYNQIHIWLAKDAGIYRNYGLDATVDWFVKRVSKRPYPTLKGIQYLLDEVAPKIPQARSAKPEQFTDLSLLKQLEKEGFFAEMAKQYP